MCVFIGRDKEVAFDCAVWLSLGTVFRRVPEAVLRVLKKTPVHVLFAEVEARAWDGSGKAVVYSLSGWGYAWLMDDAY